MTATVDPWAGSYFMESLTDEVEEKAAELFDRIEGMGGAVRAIEQGWMQSQIEESAYQEALRQERLTSVVVGVNRFAGEGEVEVPVLAVDPALENSQRARLAGWRAARSQPRVDAALDVVEETARTERNLLPPMREALAAGATVGEVSNALRRVFGVYRP
jgi:methylmalonyl-CoA mutase N-terminal domain/subunit